MVHKKVKLRNSGSTLTGLIMTLLIVIGIFFAGYAYISEHTINSGITLDSKYADIYTELNKSQNEMQNTSDQIKDSADKIVEAESTFQVAWNGLKGLGNTLKLPLQMTGTTFAVWTAFSTFTDFFPDWILGLVLIGIVTFVVFLIVKILKGEPSM